MPKDKYGNKLTWKEFFSRWKQGIEEIKPLQKMKTQVSGTKIILIGTSLGLTVSLFNFKTLWWVAIILFGALINTSIQYLGLKQQYDMLVKIEKRLEEESKNERRIEE